jgi:hypothetical protein
LISSARLWCEQHAVLKAGPCAKLHLELLVGLQVQHKGVCLGDLQDASPAGSERLCDETDATMTAAAVKQLRRRLVDSVEKRVDAADFDESGAEIDYGSDAVKQAQAAEAAARDVEIVRNAAEAAASAVAGNLTKGRRALIESGPSAAVAMLTAAAPKVAKQEGAREEAAELVERHGWDYDLGNANRGIYSTADFNRIVMNLDSLKLAAEMQLTELNRQQPAPANTLDDVLKELNRKAKAGTKSNDYIQAVELCASGTKCLSSCRTGASSCTTQSMGSIGTTSVGRPIRCLLWTLTRTSATLWMFSVEPSRSKTGMVTTETRTSS